MALATLSNPPTVIADGESITGWSGDTFELEPNIKKQGDNSVACAQTTNGNNDTIFTKASGSWDFSGGVCIIEEAGGKLSTLKGNALT